MSVTNVRTYMVQVFRDSGSWILEVPELRAVGQSRTLSSAEKLSRGAVWRLRQAARRLVRADGLSLRDAATVLGVTFGRVQQLLKD